MRTVCAAAAILVLALSLYARPRPSVRVQWQGTQARVTNLTGRPLAVTIGRRASVCWRGLWGTRLGSVTQFSQFDQSRPLLLSGGGTVTLPFPPLPHPGRHQEVRTETLITSP